MIFMMTFIHCNFLANIIYFISLIGQYNFVVAG